MLHKVHFLLHNVHCKDLIACGSNVRLDLKQLLDHLREIRAIVSRDFGVSTLQNPFIEPIHIIGSEGWLQGCHFVQYTAERPNVALVIIGLIPPYLWRCIVWSTCLSIQKSLFRDL